MPSMMTMVLTGRQLVKRMNLTEFSRYQPTFSTCQILWTCMRSAMEKISILASDMREEPLCPLIRREPKRKKSSRSLFRLGLGT